MNCSMPGAMNTGGGTVMGAEDVEYNGTDDAMGSGSESEEVATVAGNCIEDDAIGARKG
jgi:hypothetical protein